MDRPFNEDECGDEQEVESVGESWLKDHNDLYREPKKPRRRKKTKKSKRRRMRHGDKPYIKIRSHRKRICPSCKMLSLADTIKGGMCLGCQVAIFLDTQEQ